MAPIKLSGEIEIPVMGMKFGFMTTGLEGGAHSVLEITIDSGFGGQMSVAANGAALPEYGAGSGEKVVVRLCGDIELTSAAEGLEFLAHRIRQALTGTSQR
jgi:hypothetical protein